MWKSIYWIRHGWQGDAVYNTDLPLLPEGRLQAEHTGQRLARCGIQVLFSSHLLRARETAEIINAHLHVPHEVREALQEIDCGVFTGRTPAWARAHYPDYFEARAQGQEDVPYPGGENGAMVLARIQPVLQELAQRPEERIAVVCHGYVIRSLAAAVLGMPQAHRFRLGVELENCGISEIGCDTEDGVFRLQSLNDADHLIPYPHLRRSALKTQRPG